MNGAKTLLVCPQADFELGLFKDLAGSGRFDVKYIKLRKGSCRWISKALNTFKFIFGINLKTPEWIYDNRIEEGYERYIFRSNTLQFIPFSRIKEIKDRGRKCELMLLDSMDAGSFTIAACRKYIKSELWDRIVTFDSRDAEKYGFDFDGFHYYSKQDIDLPDNPSFDIYNLSSVKGGRFGLVSETHSYLESKGVKCNFDLLTTNMKDSRKADGGINCFCRSIPYSEVLRRVADSGCILEILQNGQSGPSLRYFEAVVYNRKLLTNNPHITEFPYYNPKWMRVFEKPEDIDISWLLSREKVDYEYKGDFSPVYLK